ncbi:MAG: metallophosphatase domain-containing protein [bacterium]
MTERRALRVVALSDTHGYHDRIAVPEGDVLIHAGDLTRFGKIAEIEPFDSFLARLPHRHKLVIAGNHDWCFQREGRAARELLRSATYLEDEALEIEGWRFYGSPWQPEFMNWAFNLPRGPMLREKWALIPTATDVLITHGPPLGAGDRTFGGEHVGCEELAVAVSRLAPRFHVFGHIHEAAGVIRGSSTTFVNAASCDLFYEPVQPPVVFDLVP